MEKTSTQTQTTPKSEAQAMTPREKTLDFLRQFARIYVPMATMPGIVLN